MKTLNALRTGFRATNRSFQMIILLYGINFLLSATLAWGVHSVLVRTIGDSMSLERLAKDFDYTVFTDYMVKYGGRITALLSQLSWLIFFYFLLNTLLGGGIIGTLNSGNHRFSMRTFFENCGAYCFRFFRLLLIFAVVFIVVVLVSIAALGAVYSAFARDAISEVWPFTFGVILSLTFLFIVMLVVMMADYAKVMTVVTEAQSMLKTSWQGIKFVFRHFFSTVMLQITFVIILLAAIIGYLVVENYVGMATPFAILAMFFVQQLSVGLKILMRVAAYSGELELYWDL